MNKTFSISPHDYFTITVMRFTILGFYGKSIFECTPGI